MNHPLRWSHYGFTFLFLTTVFWLGWVMSHGTRLQADSGPTPTPINEQLLFSYETGSEGWAPGSWYPAGAGGATQTTLFASHLTHGLQITSTAGGVWFGVEPTNPLNLSAYNTLLYDVQTLGEGTSHNVAFKVGSNFEWCESSWGWIAENITTTVTIDLTAPYVCANSGTHPINRSDIRGIYIFYSPGTFYQDYLRAVTFTLPTPTATATQGTLTPTPTLGPTPTLVSPPAGFVDTSGTQFTLNGQPYRFAGTNNYYLIFKSQYMVDDLLQTAADNNFQVIRTWGFLDIGNIDGTNSVDGGPKEGVYFQYWNGSAPVVNEGPDGLQRLDYVIYKANQLGIRLIIPLTNNWTAFGGMDQYVRWRGGSHHSDFYTDPLIQQWFKHYIERVLNHVNVYTGVAYKNDPTILAWELTNEARCKGTGVYPSDPACNTETIVNWAADLSAHVKTIAPYQLVAMGDEGFLCDDPNSEDWTINCSEGVDNEALTALTHIDFMSFHLYPDHWNKTAEWGVEWIRTHQERANALNKPLLLGEFGWQNHAERENIYQLWTQTIRNDGGSDLFWMLAAHRDDTSLYPDYDGFTVYCPSAFCDQLRTHSQQLSYNQEYLPEVAVYLDVHGTPLPTLTPAATPTIPPTHTPSATPEPTVTGTPTATGTPTSTPTITPTPLPLTLFSFETGPEGWGPAAWDPQGTVTQTTTFATDGTHGLEITSSGSNGGWYGLDFATTQNFTGRATLRFDLQTGAVGTSYNIAFKSGTNWTWCELPSWGWVDPNTTVTHSVDLTQDFNCGATQPLELDQIQAIYIFASPGTFVVDYFRLE